MTTLSTLPTYPVPLRQTEIVFALGGVGANYLRAWCTVAPEGSDLATKLKTSTQNRVLVYQGDGGTNHPWRFTADKGGKFTLVAQEYTKGTGYGGGYENDPNGAESETKVGSETTLSLYLGQRMTSTIGLAPDSATLLLWVWDATIRPTTLATHGEKTPAVTADAPTPKAKAAIEAAAVTTALAALQNVAVATAVGTISTIVSEMVTDLNAHNALGASHNVADTANAIKVENGSAPTAEELPGFVNSALLYQRRHRTNDDGATTSALGGTGSANYHNTGGIRRADFTNMPLFQSVSGLEDGYAALADIWRAHEGHRVNTTLHGAADTTNPLVALPLLLQVHLQFLTVLAALSPAVPPAQSSGATTLMSQAGFKEE